MQRSSSKPSLLIHQAWLEDIFNIVKFSTLSKIVSTLSTFSTLSMIPQDATVPGLGNNKGAGKGLKGARKSHSSKMATLYL